MEPEFHLYKRRTSDLCFVLLSCLFRAVSRCYGKSSTAYTHKAILWFGHRRYNIFLLALMPYIYIREGGTSYPHTHKQRGDNFRYINLQEEIYCVSIERVPIADRGRADGGGIAKEISRRGGR